MKCPICENKIESGDSVCSYCGLKVVDISKANNKRAKEIKLHGTLLEKEKIFSTNKLPNDVDKKTLWQLLILTGFAGGHNFYVGKYVKAVLCLLGFVIGNVMLILFTQGIALDYYSIGGALVGLPVVAWLYDIILLAISKFSVPVALPSDVKFKK